MFDFKSKEASELVARRSAIASEIEAPEANLDALEEEVRAINEELEKRKAEEAKRVELRKAVAESNVPAQKINKEDTKMSEVRTFAVDTVEYRDAYMKSLMGKQMEAEERAALASAASVIPTETVNKIYGKLEENPLIREVNALHIPGYVAVPKATTINDAAWVAVGNAASDSGDVIASVPLTAKKLIKTIEITADIQAMSIPAFESWLVSKLAAKMEKAICAAIINGAGTTTVPTGILKGRNADETGVSTVAKLSTLMGKLGGAYHNGAVWIMSSGTFYGTIVPLCADQNGIFVMNGMEARLLGHKVVIDDNCEVTASGVTTKNILFGNLNEGYVFNYGEGIAIEADQSVAFRSGSTVYRAMALCDGNVADAEAFVLGTV